VSHIANFVACIQRGVQCHKTVVGYPNGPKFLKNIASVLYSEGLIMRYVIENDPARVSVYLKAGVIRRVKIVSTPGRKYHVSSYKLASLVYKNPRVVYIVSTAYLGIVSSRIALSKNLGGEVLCSILHV
jgi:ribosomal protein S8